MPNEKSVSGVARDSLDLSSLADRYRSGQSTPLDVADEISGRITRFSQSSVWIQTLSPEQLRAEARRVMAARSSGAVLPLYGVPFAVKDNIDVASMPTTAACPRFAYMPADSAPVVTKLRDAGAMLVGKTNLDQFAAGLVGTRSPFGICRNPFDPRYISGGSSSGSAVAVSAGLVSFSLGTDTAGSGRVPAGFNNIVGLKPTRGLLSTRGVVPACRSLDCVSIFALTCGDAADVARVAAGFDEADPFSRTSMEIRPKALRGISGLTFGIPAAPLLQFFGDSEAERLFAEAINRLTRLGAIAVEIDFAPFGEAARLLYQGPWVAERLAALAGFFARHADAVLPVTRSIIEGGSKYDAVAAFKALHQLTELKQMTRPLWGQIDCLLVPTAPTIYTVEQVEADPISLNINLGYYTNFVNLMDLCAVSVPGSFRHDGLPAGVTLISPAGGDDLLLSIAGEFHQDTGLPLGYPIWTTSTSTTHEIESQSPSRIRPIMSAETVQIAVVGAHLSGQPLNHQLTLLNARLIRTCRTAPHYRLFALAGTVPPKPGLVRSANTMGIGIEVEVWEMTAEAFGRFVAAIPPPLGIATLELEDGTSVKGFVCEDYSTADALEITHFGGWRKYLGSS